MGKQGIRSIHPRLDGANVTRDVFIDRQRNLLYFYSHMLMNRQTTFTFFFGCFDRLLLAFLFTLFFSVKSQVRFVRCMSYWENFKLTKLSVLLPLITIYCFIISENISTNFSKCINQFNKTINQDKNEILIFKNLYVQICI